MTKRIAMLILISGLLFASACQPTPEGSTMELRERDSFDFSEDEPMPIATETPSATARPLELVPAEAGQYDAPAFRSLEPINDEINNENYYIRVVFDAEVNALDRETWPVVKLAPSSFSPEELGQFVTLFARGRDVFHEPPLDKEYYELRIAKAIAAAERDGSDASELLAHLRAELATAPSEVELVPFDIALDASGQPRIEGGAFNAVVTSEAESEQYAWFGLNQKGLTYSEYMDAGFQPLSWLIEDGGYEGEGPVTEINVESITEAEARAAADSVLNTLGVKHMALDWHEPVRYTDIRTVLDTAWLFTYTYSPDGMFCEDMGMATGINKKYLPSIGAPWDDTRIHVIVNGKGVQYMWYEGATPVMESVLEDDLELLDMDRLKKCISDQFCFRFANAAAENAPQKITVYKMNLCYAVLSVPNALSQGQLVPVWYVYYTMEPESGGAITYRDDKYFLVIAAHNGSYVEPGLTSVELNSRYN